jgi:hypothetical protein
MKTKKHLLVLLVIAALLLTTVPVSAATIRTPIDAIEYVCLKMPGQEWVAGNVYHLRGQIHENVVVANGEIWGINTASIEFDYNLKTGQMVARASADFVPLGADGGYSGIGFFRFFGAGARPVFGLASLQGYGDLQGQSIHLDMDELPPDPSAGSAYCAGHGEYLESVLWDGYTQGPDS